MEVTTGSGPDFLGLIIIIIAAIGFILALLGLAVYFWLPMARS